MVTDSTKDGGNMEDQHELDLLQRYATIAKQKVLTSPSELDSSNGVMPEMLGWCQQQDSLVVLESGDILTCEPSSRIVQNCKAIMHNKQLLPGQVYPATRRLIAQLLSSPNASANEPVADNVINVSQSEQRLRGLVRDALNTQASAIHIELRNEKAIVRLRRYGELQTHSEWFTQLTNEVMANVFEVSVDAFITDTMMTTTQHLCVDDKRVEVHYTVLPADVGYDVVMRLRVINAVASADLNALGFLPSQIKTIEHALQQPHGAVLISGPRDAGKMTSLATCQAFVGQQRKVFNLETVRRSDSATDKDGLVANVLALDPDMLAMGDVNDRESANLLADVVLSGYLAAATLHSNSAVGVISRLHNLGLSFSLLATPGLINAIVCQRLAPVLCKHCAVPVAQSEAHQDHQSRWYETFEDAYLQLRARGTDCAHCQGFGVGGRTVVAEVIELGERDREYIRQGDMLGWTHYLQQSGWKNFKEHLMVLVKAGACDPLDAERMIGQIGSDVSLKRSTTVKQDVAVNAAP